MHSIVTIKISQPVQEMNFDQTMLVSFQ